MHILFLCTANAIRSQMAEGLARHMAPKGITIYSAGTHPGGVHPLAVAVMNEVGIDISHHHSKSLEAIPINQIDLIITLCGNADQVCAPAVANIAREHWPIPDPYHFIRPGEDPLTAFRQVREDIRGRLQKFFEKINTHIK